MGSTLGSGLGSDNALTILTMMASFAYFQDQPIRMVVLGLVFEYGRKVLLWLLDRLRFSTFLKFQDRPKCTN